MGLIANATDPNKRLDMRRVYIQILSQLEPLDLRILQYLDGLGWKMISGVPGGGVNIQSLTIALSVPEREIRLSLQNLDRLNCLIAVTPQTYESTGTALSGNIVMNPDTFFRPSPLGFSLIEACKQ